MDINQFPIEREPSNAKPQEKIVTTVKRKKERLIRLERAVKIIVSGN